MITSILTERVVEFIVCNGLFHEEKKRFKNESCGCKYQFLINKMIMEKCQFKLKNISITWIDDKNLFRAYAMNGI